MGAPCARGITYDPSTGKAWRTGVKLQPGEAAKAIRAAEQLTMSVNGLLAELIRRMPVDKEGRPLWPGDHHVQEEIEKS